LYTDILAELEVPVVLLNNQHPSEFLHSVSIDNVSGAREATEHLAQLGHQRIAYVGDRSGMQSDSERCAGYRLGLEKHGLHFDPELVAQGDGKPAGASLALQELLHRHSGPTAIFCYNDMSALGVLEQAAKNGLRVPQDLSVCGFDDLFFTPFLNPALTTVHQPKRELGAAAMQLLLDVLSGERNKTALHLPGRLIVRNSTAPPRA
jgi:DNA-binding LacI/PurR family transcriptional regulator